MQGPINVKFMIIIIWNSLKLRVIRQDYSSCCCYSWELPAIFFPILTKTEFSRQVFSKSAKRKSSSKSVQWDPTSSLPPKDERRGRQKYMTKPKLIFTNLWKLLSNRSFFVVLRDKSSHIRAVTIPSAISVMPICAQLGHNVPAEGLPLWREQPR